MITTKCNNNNYDINNNNHSNSWPSQEVAEAEASEEETVVLSLIDIFITIVRMYYRLLVLAFISLVIY